MQTIFSAQSIAKRYATHTALDDVSIEIPSQTIFGLLGPNGAGKTSLIRIINQITGPDSGKLFFNGEKLSPHHITKIGYLPEERGLYKKMKVGEQALYFAQLKGMSKAEAKIKLMYWFEKFEIDAWWNKTVEELSKGMQQKVQFIIAVLHGPELLILDEPFSGFDPINTNLIKDEILHLKEQGSTILFSTHNMESVEELCDNIALINQSKKILGGSVSEIREQHKSNVYEVEFIGTMMGFTNSLWTFGKLISQKVEGDRCKVKVELNPKASANSLLEAVLSDVKIISFKEIVPSMNDIFISKVSPEINELSDESLAE